MKAQPKKKAVPNFLNGVPLLLVLKLLSEREMYGYEIVRSIHEKTGRSLSFAEGSIYPVLHVLEEDGHVKSRRKDHQGRTRLYYGLTASGSKKLEQLTGEWRKVSQGVHLLLSLAKGGAA